MASVRTYELSGLIAGLSCAFVACAHESSTPPMIEPAAVRAQTQAQTETRPQHYVSPYAYAAFIRAELLRARGDLAGALGAYRMTLADAEEDPYVLARFATALDAHGERPDAEHALDDALELDAASEAAWLARAQIARAHGELDAALLAYERAESSAPASSTAPVALAALLREHHDDERALAVLARFEARTLPGSAGAARARLEVALARDDETGAYEAARAWLRISNTADPTLLETVRSLVAQDKAPLALSLLQALPAREADAPLRLRVLLACGKNAAAETLLATNTPDAFGGLVKTAEAYRAVGRPEQALALLELAKQRDPADTLAIRLATQLELELAGMPALARELSQGEAHQSPVLK